MGNRSEKTGIRDKPRVCPFRPITKIDHVCFDGCEPVIHKTTVDFATCYKEGCPYYTYVVGEGYICSRVVEGG